MEKARKASTPAVLKATLADFENEIFKEQLCPQDPSMQPTQVGLVCLYLEAPNSIFKFCWSVANLSKVATPQGSPRGAGGDGTD